MKIAILGTGMVGPALAGPLAEEGHQVTIGTRQPDAAPAELRDWAADVGVALGGLPAAAAGAELVINAIKGEATLAALEAAGEESLRGKVLLDLSNALDFSQGFPPALFIQGRDSLGEQVQRRFPETKVVKALNTLTAELMLDPSSLPEPTTVFVAGNDPDAKAIVSGLLADFGHTDVIDLGGIEASRGLEQYLQLWLQVMGALGTARFNLRVVR